MAGPRLDNAYLVIRTYENWFADNDFSEPRVYQAMMCAAYGPPA